MDQLREFRQPGPRKRPHAWHPGQERLLYCPWQPAPPRPQYRNLQHLAGRRILLSAEPASAAMDRRPFMNTPYVPYSDEVEHIQPNEEALVAETVASMGRVNQRVYAKHRHGLRDAHAKSHGIVKGELHVQSDLPDYLRQGLFAQERSYPVI